MRRATFLTERLAAMQSWRFGLGRQIERIGAFLREHRFLSEETALALDRAEKAVNSLRLTIAFVAEAGRGKSELINALFFAEGGRRLLPAGPGRTTRCVTEIRFDRGVQTSIRLLPIETRENPSRLDDLLEDAAQWRVIPFEADNADSTQRALAALSETKRISIADAVAWGLHAQGVAAPAEEARSTLVDVPRWRYAVINFPHPMLDSGLVIIDTPGLAAFTTEPELARQRVPSADAILFMLDANEPASKADLTIWRDHLGGGPGASRGVPSPDHPPTRLVVLNKIDLLSAAGGAAAENTAMPMQQIDERTRLAAELLRIDPIHVVAISARLAVAGRLANEPDSDIRSRLYQLERALSAGLPAHRQDALTAALTPVLEDALEAAQQMLDDDRFETLEQLREMSGLRAKNEKLGASIGSQTTLRQDRLDAALRELRSVRNVHAKLGDQLSSLVDLAEARREAATAREAVATRGAGGGAAQIISQYLAETRERIVAIETKIEEIREMYSALGERMRREFGIGVSDVHPFATQRFHTELQKIHERADSDFLAASNLMVRRKSALGEQFQDLIGNRVVHIFEIAAREASAWMRGLYTAVEKPLEKFRDETLQRVANAEKLKGAEIDLAGQIAGLQGHLDAIRRKHEALRESRGALARFAGQDDGEGDAFSTAVSAADRS